MEQIDQALSINDYSRAAGLCASAMTEFPGDSELLALDRASQQGVQITAESQRLLEQAIESLDAGEETRRFRIASSGSPARPFEYGNFLTRLLDVLIADAREKLESDWSAAAEPVTEAS